MCLFLASELPLKLRAICPLLLPKPGKDQIKKQAGYSIVQCGRSFAGPSQAAEANLALAMMIHLEVAPTLAFDLVLTDHHLQPRMI